MLLRLQFTVYLVKEYLVLHADNGTFLKKAKRKPAPAPASPADGQGLGAMRADAAAFVPGQGFVSEKAEVPKSRRAAAPVMSEASKRMPTYEKKDWIIAGIRHNIVLMVVRESEAMKVSECSILEGSGRTVISGDTGCGKPAAQDSFLVEVCDAENLVPDDKVVVCTQPRRVAAITLAEYVPSLEQEQQQQEQEQEPEQQQEQEHKQVGYQIRFINKFCETTRLDSIGCLIIDEVYTDFLLLLLKEAMLNGRMPHLKVHIPGRMYAVEDYYWDACEWIGFCPPDKGAGKGGKGKKGKDRDDGGAEDKIEACYQAIKKDETPKGPAANELTPMESWPTFRMEEGCKLFEIRMVIFLDSGLNTLRACALWRQCEELVHYFHHKQPKGDGAILIFLPGENYKLITLHSLMTPEQQHEAFEKPPPGYRKVTPALLFQVVYVIDTGVRKERTYDAGTGISALDAKMVTKANAIQRRGYKFGEFDQFPLPQMLSSSMEEVVLQSKVIHGGSNTEISSMLTNSMAAPQPQAKSAQQGRAQSQTGHQPTPSLLAMAAVAMDEATPFREYPLL
ncbi:ATP-dependent RNA helicase DHX36 [Symbiodinium microadriaticum]|uniref:ATP-dependent RNA helicase DHX36 n=1 Tax=Symbiodinium microadriaticum TaxID=2951 RepID=A0A1Q9E4H4_SYMMI|nr:ATP-dependent RNA helicase DHX36 [Symbiodinium microadriaticum]